MIRRHWWFARSRSSSTGRANCKLWAPDLPFEVIGGDTDQRRTTWLVSNCPLKLVNYESC